MNSLFLKMVNKAKALNIPIKITIELNRQCNLQCAHCYHNGFDGHSLTYEQLDKLWPQLVDAGTLQVTFTGGEILLHPELTKIIQAARSHHFDIHLLTNLTNLTEKQALLFKESGVSLVRTSLYFPDAARHDAFVGVKGSWQKSVAAWDLLHQLGIPVKVQVVFMEQNVESIGAMEELAAAHHAHIAGVYFMDPANDGTQNPLAFMPTYDTLLRAVNNQPQARLLSPWMKIRECGDDICGAATISGFIDADFNLWPCLSWPKAAGSLKVNSFKELFYGQVMQEARELLSTPISCKKCDKRQYCMPCLGLILREGLDLQHINHYRCRQAECYKRVWNP